MKKFIVFLCVLILCGAETHSFAQNGGFSVMNVYANDVYVGDTTSDHIAIHSNYLQLYPLSDSEIAALPGPEKGALVYAADADNIVFYNGDSWYKFDGTLYMEVFYCGYETLNDSRNSMEYSTVKIGNQCWMAENLNIGTMVASNAPGNWQTDNGIIEKYCYNNQSANCDTYGGLYQWRELMDYVLVEGGQGICPNGWHVPSTGEWSVMQNYLSDNGFGYGGSGNDIAKALASQNTWNSSTTPGHIGNDQSSNNASGFSALGTGFRWTDDGSFQHLNQATYFWTSTATDGTFNFRRRLRYDQSTVETFNSNHLYGFSVRCILD
ncbi:MAG: hypothetical protein EOM05_07575 [Clostridia bacterium]|nr:hypothetical protein [Clostridia bacterium]